jgi:Mrp family chromosome partitioning ATPase
MLLLVVTNGQTRICGIVRIRLRKGMSKIFEAYKKTMGNLPDLTMAVEQAGSLALYPAPVGVQRNDFNKLANRLLGLRAGTAGAVLAFGSSAPGEGASYVSYNAAMYLAKVYEQKVAWVDGNFLSPQKKLIQHGSHSFSSLLKAPEEAAGIAPFENPLLIPAGVDLRESRGLLASDRYRSLVQSLSNQFDYVILDLPPVQNSTDTALMAAVADGFLLVIEQKNLKVEVIEDGLQGMREKGVQVLGAVINRRSFELPKVIYDRL